VCEGQDDDLVLELREMQPQATSILFNLSSSVRAQRAERCTVPRAWFYLEPVPLKFKTIIDMPHIHIGRSQKMVNGYTKNRFGLDLPPWNARACVLGLPLEMTFEPCFRASDAMLMEEYGGGDGYEDDDTPMATEVASETVRIGAPETVATQVLPPPSHASRGGADAEGAAAKKRKRDAARAAQA
jgi:hypothetical protein